MKKLLNIILVLSMLLLVSGCGELSDPIGDIYAGDIYSNGSLITGGTAVDNAPGQANKVITAFDNVTGEFTLQQLTADNISGIASNSTVFPWMPDQQALQYKGSSYLTNSTANFRSADSSGAIEVWVKTSSTANNQVLFCSSDIGTATSFIRFFIVQTTGQLRIDQQDNAGAVDRVTGANNICDGKWHQVILSSSGTAYSIYLDGVAEALVVGIGSNSGDWFSDTTLRDNLTIGAQVHSGGVVNLAIADIGVTRIYSRPMLVAEALTNYQRGRKATASDTTGLVYNLNLNEQSGNPVDKVGSLTMTRQGTTLPIWLNSDGVFTDVGKTVRFTGSTTMNMTDGGTNQFNSPVIVGVTNYMGLYGDYAGLGELPAGTLVNPVGQGITIIPNGTGSSGKMTMLGYYNGTSWFSAVEIANVSSGKGNLNLMKSGGTITANATVNMTANKIVNLAAPTANGDAVRYENLTLPNANLSSSANQTSGGTTTANNVTFNSNDQLVGITHSTSTNTSQIWTQQAGAYLITFSAIALSSAPNKHIGIWLVKNGTNVPNSDTRVEISATGNERLITVTYIIQLLAAEYVELKWCSFDDAGMILQATNSLTSPARPNCPSVILTINKVSN